jgi:hypothetical protein
VAVNRKKRIEGLIRKTKRFEEIEVDGETEVVTSEASGVQKESETPAEPVEEAVTERTIPTPVPPPVSSSPPKFNPRRRG